MELAVLAEELRNVRIKLCLAQKELGNMIGVTRQLITRIESETQNVTIGTLQKLAVAINYDFTIELKQKKGIKQKT